VLGSLDGHTGFIAGRIAELELHKRTQARAAWPAAWARVDAAATKVTHPGN
jgi:hypothetical protein